MFSSTSTVSPSGPLTKVGALLEVPETLMEAVTVEDRGGVPLSCAVTVNTSVRSS